MQDVQVTQADNQRLQECHQGKQTIAAEISHGGAEISDFFVLAHIGFQNGAHQQTAHPNGQNAVKRRHGGAVVLHGVNMGRVHLNGRRDKVCDQGRFVADQIHQAGQAFVLFNGIQIGQQSINVGLRIGDQCFGAFQRGNTVFERSVHTGQRAVQRGEILVGGQQDIGQTVEACVETVDRAVHQGRNVVLILIFNSAHICTQILQVCAQLGQIGGGKSSVGAQRIGGAACISADIVQIAVKLIQGGYLAVDGFFQRGFQCAGRGFVFQCGRNGEGTVFQIFQNFVQTPRHGKKFAFVFGKEVAHLFYIGGDGTCGGGNPLQRGGTVICHAADICGGIHQIIV